MYNIIYETNCQKKKKKKKNLRFKLLNLIEILHGHRACIPEAGYASSLKLLSFSDTREAGTRKKNPSEDEVSRAAFLRAPELPGLLSQVGQIPEAKRDDFAGPSRFVNIKG